MKPESKYRKEPSSSPETRRALSYPSERTPWRPDDRKPSVRIFLPDNERKYIERVIVTKTDNVRSVTVEVNGRVRTENCYLTTVDNLIWFAIS